MGLLLTGVFANQAFAVVDPGTGYVEVCKNANPASNPAPIGNFTFSITDAATTQSVTIPIGTCSQPIAVVSGAVT